MINGGGFLKVVFRDKDLELCAMDEAYALRRIKKNVSDSIRPEFEDFNSSGREFNEDNFLANCASIERIFKILKRFGFDL